MAWSTAPTGTMSHTARGLVSFPTNSAGEAVPIAFSFTSAATGSGSRLNTTHWWPPRNRRRTMLAPMRPRPIIPNCTPWPSLEDGCSERADRSVRSCSSRDRRRPGCTVRADVRAASDWPLELAIAPDQRIGRAVVLKLGLTCALELGNDPLGESLAQFHPPLIEGIDLPDRALGEDAVLVERDQLAEHSRRQTIEENSIGG